jgi:hypothetical protein
MGANLLPLYSWFRIIGWNPWHAFGLADTTGLALTNDCDSLVHRYAWQNSDAAGHIEIEEAIATAEARLGEYLGYNVAPQYAVKTIPWPRYHDASMMRWTAADTDGRRLNLALGEGYVQALGIEAHTAISLGAAVVYSDADGDGYQETFTVGPVATTVTDAAEVAAYIAAADRLTIEDEDSAIGPRWRIQPVRVTISGGLVTITGPRQVLVKPVRYEGVTNVGAGLSPANASTDFVTTLDVYRHYTNRDGTTSDTSQAVLVWETLPSSGCCGSVSISTAFSGSPFDPAAVANAIARVGIRDARRGLITPAEATYDAATGIWSSLNWTLCEEPDRVLVRFLSGYPLDSTGQMDKKWRTIVARMAAAELDKPLCGCSEANRRVAYWQFDLARTAGANDEQYGTTQAILECPFGTRRGQWYAWQQVSNLQTLRGFAVG